MSKINQTVSSEDACWDIRKVISLLRYHLLKLMSIILPHSYSNSNISIFCFISPEEFDRYEIAWYKLKPGTRNTWIKLFRYKIKDPQRQSSLLYALETYSDDDLFKFFRSRGRFRAYDKAYYGDFFAPLHVLEIDKMELQDLGTYKVTVKHLKSGAWSEKMIELRHEGKCWDRVGFHGRFKITLVLVSLFVQKKLLTSLFSLVSFLLFWHNSKVLPACP